MLSDELRLILEELSPEGREQLRTTPEDGLIRYHFNLGRGLRNGFRQGRFPCLLHHCHQAVEGRGETMSFDELSSEAIHLLWKQLQASV